MTLRDLAQVGDKTHMTAAFALRDARPIKRQVDDTTVEVLRVEGHASVFDVRYEVFGGPAVGGWYERINRAAFDATLAADPDVVFLLNHEGMTMARTKSGTLKLEADKEGLYQRADLDLRNPDAIKLGSAIERGDIDEMSFAFWVRAQAWEAHDDYPDDPMSDRELTEIDIHRGDVAAVNFGASPTTDIDMIRSLQALDEQELEEALAVINRRLGKRQEAPGSPGDTLVSASRDELDLLRIPSNPILEEMIRGHSRADQAATGAARRAS